MGRPTIYPAATTTTTGDPSATLVMGAVTVAAGPAATTILNIPGFLSDILTDQMTYRRQARQRRRSNRGNTRPLILATAAIVFGLGLMGFPFVHDMISLIASCV